jgi:uncharacterized protein (TIGR02145 family)
MKTKLFRNIRHLLLTAGCALLTFITLAAQGNGVTVSGLAVNAGTVTFNVSWNKDNPDMPELWSDSVWVFVDYNNAGKMERLPLSAGATLTATSAPDMGKVKEEPDNNKGVWVIGNARTTGSFSATVQLLTATADIAGACAYASNYPPVGEYTATDKITFTGAPPYDIIFNNGSSLSINNSDYDIPTGVTIASFTDKTGAPGIVTCMPPTTYTLSGSAVCLNGTVTLTLSGSQSGWKYQLYKGSMAIGSIKEGTGSALTFSEAATATGTFNYTVQRVSPANAQCEMPVSDVRSITVHPLPTITIQPAATSVCSGGTVMLSVTASNTTAYRWYKNGSATGEGSNYTSAAYTTAALTAAATYSVVVANGSCSVTSSNAVVSVTTTVPGATVNFTAFCPASNAATGATWTLQDTRDSKTYKVVKMADRRIWMAQNLNYTKDLTANATSQAPGNVAGSGSYAIGSYWCPANSTTSGASTACDVYGALYTWETAMMVDGRCADAAKTSCGANAWTESWVSSNTYTSGAPGSTANADKNNARGATNVKGGGRGICPEDWHVPTEYEWADMLTAVDPAGTYLAQTGSNSGSGSTGTAGSGSEGAGVKLKSAATYTDTDPGNGSWLNHANRGSNSTGFGAVPAGARASDGLNIYNRGAEFNGWSSSVHSAANAWYYLLYYHVAQVYRFNNIRSYGFSVRCVRD